MSSRAQFRWAEKPLLPKLFLGLALVVLLLPRPAPAQLPTNDSLGFFTNVVDWLLKASTAEWLAADFHVYTNTFKTDQPFGATNIPVFINGQMVYAAPVQRLLQVAANLWEITPNARAAEGLPTVFRPRFMVQNGNIYISDFVEEPTFDSIIASTSGRPIIDILSTNNPAALIPSDGNVQIFGVPPVVGARKGLPNFNEFQSEAIFTLTRKIQLRRSGGVIDQTNQFYTISLTMPSAAEFWNSYASNYFPAGGVILTVTNRTTLTMTNDLGVSLTQTFVTGDRFTTNDVWPGVREAVLNKSFYVLMRTNVPFLPTVGYLPGMGFVSATNQNLFDVSQHLLMPRWGVTITNRVHAMILRQSDNSIIDYVLLGNMVYQANLSDLIVDAAAGTGNAFEQLWATNNYAPNPALLSGRLGVQQQIMISLGSEGYPPPESEWRQFGTFAPSSPENEIARFQNLYFDSASNGLFNVPFTPTIQFRVPMVWQANDPLVHYNANDLLYLDESGKTFRIQPPVANSPGVLANIGAVNQRYKPWDEDPISPTSNPNAHNLSLKDPLVTSSDSWQFPTNVALAVELLGQVHRGTPWQTLYLKSSDLGLSNAAASPTEWAESAVYYSAAQNWANWSGHANLAEGFYTRPVSDRSLVTVIASMLNTNDPRPLLSVNDLNSDNWLAVFDGITVLTNTRPNNSFSKAQFANLTMTSNSPQALLLAEAIAMARSNQPGEVFRSLGSLLTTPELTTLSPWLNYTGAYQLQRGISDEAYEKIPSQLLALVRADSIGAIRHSAATTQIQFTGYDGFPYAIECSTNLLNWIPVSTNYPTNGVFELAVPTTPATDAFYRSALLP